MFENEKWLSQKRKKVRVANTAQICKNTTQDTNTVQRQAYFKGPIYILGISSVSTWTVWTCGDWITDGWAAWITPCTWTVCPLGSWTKVTVGAEDVAWAAGIDTCKEETVSIN